VPVRGLTIVVAEPAPERLRAALTLAMANAALGGQARVFCQGPAVALLAPPMTAPHDVDHVAAGLPTLAEMIEEGFGLGVELIACQSGLHLMGVDASTLDPRISFGGPVSVLQTLGEDRLLIA
jgi:predicted peroxiredoxin